MKPQSPVMYAIDAELVELLHLADEALLPRLAHIKGQPRHHTIEDIIGKGLRVVDVAWRRRVVVDG